MLEASVLSSGGRPVAAVSNLVVDLVASGSAGCDAETVGLEFFRRLIPLGATAINARGYQSSRDLNASGLVFVRTAPECFLPAYGEPRFYTGNPLPFEAQRRSRPFLWSEISWSDPRWKWVHDVMHDCGCPDGICVPCHGPSNYLGAVSIAFERLSDISPEDLLAVQLASYFMHERMKDLAGPVEPSRPALSSRERDCLEFVAEGMSDHEIAERLNVSAPTVAFHIGNARLKLGAKTRAQAVARFFLPSL